MVNLIYCMLGQQDNDKDDTEDDTLGLIKSMKEFLDELVGTNAVKPSWIPDYIQADGEMDDAMAIALASLWNPNLHVSLQLPTKEKYVEAMGNDEGSDQKFDAAVATLKKKGYHVFEDPLSGNSDKLKTGLKAFA